MKNRVVVGFVVVVVIVLVGLGLRGRATPVELTEVTVRAVREYVSEDAKTRLADEYMLTMPVMGTVERIPFKVGDVVESGQCVVRVDPFGLEQHVRGV